MCDGTREKKLAGALEEIAEAVMTPEEKKLQSDGLSVQAIKSVKDRLGLRLVVVKELVDARRNHINRLPVQLMLTREQVGTVNELLVAEKKRINNENTWAGPTFYKSTDFIQSIVSILKEALIKP